MRWLGGCCISDNQRQQEEAPCRKGGVGRDLNEFVLRSALYRASPRSFSLQYGQYFSAALVTCM